jgi:hypothetical protein
MDLIFLLLVVFCGSVDDDDNDNDDNDDDFNGVDLDVYVAHVQVQFVLEEFIQLPWEGWEGWHHLR